MIKREAGELLDGRFRKSLKAEMERRDMVSHMMYAASRDSALIVIARMSSPRGTLRHAPMV